MATAIALRPWASDIRERNQKLAVTLRDDLDLGGVLDLLKTNDVSNVGGLRIPGSVGLSGLRAILENGAFPNLTSVAMRNFEDADDAVDVLFESPAVHSIRVLKLWDVSDAIDARLGRGEARVLRQLDIRDSPHLTSLDRYFESKRVASLRYMTLNRTSLSDASMLFHNQGVEGLRSLSLAACDFDSETVDHLVSCGRARSLRKLNLSHNPQDDVFAAIYELLTSGALQTLESLTLCGCDLESFEWDRVSFPSLRKLDVRDNPLTLEELLEILNAPGLPALGRLVAHAPEEFVPADIDSRLVIDDRMPPWA